MIHMLVSETGRESTRSPWFRDLNSIAWDMHYAIAFGSQNGLYEQKKRS